MSFPDGLFLKGHQGATDKKGIFSLVRKIKGFFNRLHSLSFGGKRGAVAVEFAIVLLVVLIILFGTIEFGWAFFTKAVVTNAAREGARFAVTPFATTGDVETRVTNYLKNFLLTSTSTVRVVPEVSPGSPAEPPSGEPVTVIVTYDYVPLAGSFIVSGSWTITAEATMRRE